VDEPQTDFITASGLPDYYCVLGVRRSGFNFTFAVFLINKQLLIQEHNYEKGHVPVPATLARVSFAYI
jgi:hypothetical protein